MAQRGRALIAPDFLRATWAEPGHAVPARRSAGTAVAGDVDGAEEAIREAMEVGEVFRPHTASAFDAYSATVDIFTKMNTGELQIPDALVQLEQAANAALAPDRGP